MIQLPSSLATWPFGFYSPDILELGVPQEGRVHSCLCALWHAVQSAGKTLQSSHLDIVTFNIQVNCYLKELRYLGATCLLCPLVSCASFLITHSLVVVCLLTFLKETPCRSPGCPE